MSCASLHIGNLCVDKAVVQYVSFGAWLFSGGTVIIVSVMLRVACLAQPSSPATLSDSSGRTFQHSRTF